MLRHHHQMMLGSRMSCVRADRPVIMGEGASMHQLRRVVDRPSTTSIPRGSHQEALRKSISASVIQIDRSTATTWAEDDGGSRGETPKRVPKPTPSRDVALQFIELFNRRDIPSLLDMIADDCEHHNLAYTTRYTGKREIVMFYYDFLNTIPEDITIRVEDVTAGDPHKVGVSWTMELGRMEVPGAKGVSFYRINDEGKICYMRESPEHFVKAAGMALPALNALSPLMRSMGTEAAKFIQQAGALRVGASEKRATPPIPELLSRLTIQGTSVADLLSGPPPSGSGSSVNSVSSVGGTSGRDHDGAPIEMMQLADADTASSPQDSTISEDAEPGVRVNLTGIWYKDKNDKVTQDAAYDKSMALLQLSKIQKETGKMIDSLDIKHTAAGRLSVGFITPVPYFQVVETYQLGETVQMGRRDLRKGKTTATMQLLEGGARGYVVDMTWPEPLAGNLEEVYTLLDDNTMTIQSTIRIGGAEEAVTFTYRRG